MKKLEQIITELRRIQEKLPAALQKKVGNIFLGGNTDIAKLQGIKTPKGFDYPEENTAWEKELQSNIKKWLDTSSGSVANYFKQNKALLDQLAKEFPQAVLPPIGKTAYRGTVIKLNSLEQAFRTKKFDIVKIEGREAFHFKNLDYSPNRIAQSWTVDPKVSFKFQGRTGKPGVVPVVYATKVNRDFIFSPDFMNILLPAQKEYETVRVAEKGTFEAFVDIQAITNNWSLEPKENFIHRLPSAKPAFVKMVESYNKLVEYTNKRSGSKSLPFADSVEDIIRFVKKGKDPGTYDIDSEYSKYANIYIEWIKK